ERAEQPRQRQMDVARGKSASDAGGERRRDRERGDDVLRHALERVYSVHGAMAVVTAPRAQIHCAGRAARMRARASLSSLLPSRAARPWRPHWPALPPPPSPPSPPAGASARRGESRLKVVARTAFPFLVVALAWEVTAHLGISPRKLFPPLEEVAAALIRLTAEGVLPHHVLDTLVRLLAGFALAAVAGVAIGFVMGRSRRAEGVFLPLVG